MKQLRPYQKKAVKECWEALKNNDEPVLLMASVGAGKSLMLASVLLSMQKAGKRALCLVNNAELVRNNCQTLIDEGGNASIYCAALSSKDCSSPIVFGTPQSVINGINKNEDIAHIAFNLIVVDEAHAINYLNHRNNFMRIFEHYKRQYPGMRVLGATGTNFRFKGASIVGPECLFKTQVGNITTEQLIDDGYLINPSFSVDKSLVLDFSRVTIKSNGRFEQKQLEEVVGKSARLTELICQQIVHIMQADERYGVFIFATTKKHAYEVLSHLPQEESAIILGETPQDERTDILDKARAGIIRYLVNISIISVGVDVPGFDTIAYLRPTESLVLLVQTMGRALRLSPSTDKRDSVVLDFAGNIERHRDWDNPLLLDAVKKTIDLDKPLVILCPCCNEMNTDSARRCMGKNKDSKRCDYYFEFKSCVKCEAKNDISARICHQCQEELIDPNARLSMASIDDNTLRVDVIEARYGVSGTQNGFRVNCAYKCQDESGRIGSIYEHYSPINPGALRVFYGKFVKEHCVNAGSWYMHLHNKTKVEAMLREVKTPLSLIIKRELDGSKIKKKIFHLKDKTNDTEIKKMQYKQL